MHKIKTIKLFNKGLMIEKLFLDKDWKFFKQQPRFFGQYLIFFLVARLMVKIEPSSIIGLKLSKGWLNFFSSNAWKI